MRNGSEVPGDTSGAGPEKGAEPFLPSWLMYVWRGGSAWPMAGRSPPVSQAGWHCSALEMKGCFSAARSKALPCSISCASPHALLGSPEGGGPSLYQVECIRCDGIVMAVMYHPWEKKVFPTYSIFSLSFHLGENLKDIWTN